jgi:hypothetical protein
MPSGNPPRRSKKTEEPQTIDLEAERIASAQEGDGATAAGDAPAGETKVEGSAASVETASDIPSEGADKPTAGDTVESPAEPVRPAPSKGGGSGGAGAIAAGIFGGLVALVGAGSAQYAGYIPNFGPTEKVDLSAVTSQISALQAKLDEVAQKADNPPKPDLKPLENRMKAIETAMSKLPVGDLTDVLAIQGKLNDVAGQSAKVHEELTSVASRLKNLEAKVNQPRDDIDVARAIASAGLKAAIDRGGPFLSELQTLASVAPNDKSVAALQAYAAQGVPSRSELLKRYPDAADAMLAVLDKPVPGQSLSERLFKSAFSIIKVRPVGDVKGNTPQAIIARIGDKLQSGDLAGAAKEWEGLPDEMKAAGKDFKDALDARIQVEALVSQTLNNAVTGTGKQG